MPFRPVPRRLASRAVAGATVLALVALSVGACQSSAPDTSFDSATPCTGATREQMPGAYPDLEARILEELLGAPAASRESGRFCSAESLGSILDAGVSEVHFGGGLWRIGEGGDFQLGVFEGSGLTAAMMGDEYRRTADAASRTEDVRDASIEIAGRPARRLDVSNGEVRQAIVIWPSADGSVVQVVVAANVSEDDVQAAIAAFH